MLVFKNRNLVPLFADANQESWRERNEHLFRSDESFRWFLRKHKLRLVEAGAVVLIAGRWHAAPAVLNPLVVALGQAEARRSLQSDTSGDATIDGQVA
jgi:hypothetical protein